MKNFLIITNYYKDSEARLTNHIKEYIEKKGGSCSTFFSNGETPGEAAPHREDIPENTQGVLVLGGDGTLIRAAAALVKSRLPLIGVNLGTLGYLCELAAFLAIFTIPNFPATRQKISWKRGSHFLCGRS